MSVLPGNWRAAKDLVRKTTSAVLDKTGALYTPAVDHIRNLVTNKSDIVVQRAPVLGQQPVVPICQQIPTPPTQGLLISCMLVLLSFTLGWWWGARQQRSHQAMLQAQAADKRTEELATLSLPASSSSDSKQLSTAAIAPAMYATSGDQQEQSNSMTAPLGQHQSAGPSEQSVPGPLVLPDSQRSSSPLQQAITPETEAAPSSSEQAADLGQLQELAVAAANQQPSSVDSADGVDPVPKTQLNSADAVHADGQPSCSQTSSTSAALTVPYLTAGQALDDPIGSAAGVLIQKSCQAAAISFMQLEGKDRVALVQQAFGIALNDHRQEQHHRSKIVENEQRAEHNSLVSGGMNDTRMWRQGKATAWQREEEQKQLKRFQNTLSDCLMCGLTVMMVALMYCGFSLGFLQGRLSECQTTHNRSFWQVWSVVKVTQSVLCYGNAVGDLLISALVMIGLPWFVAKQSLLTEGLKRPMTGMVLGLGVVCGIVGCFVVSRLGANYLVWLVPYEMWIALHVFVVSKVQLLYRLLNSQEGRGQFWRQSEVRMPLYLAGMGFVAPIVIAAAPFWTFML